ncbi:hypothetical protein T261_2776 [Streptomyces lydicus]|nr:hypothetical protein T261_2776 [Streptomyces lydicus]
MPQDHHITGPHRRAVLHHQLVAGLQRRHHRRVVDLGQPERPQRPAARPPGSSRQLPLPLRPALIHPLRHPVPPGPAPVRPAHRSILHQPQPGTGLLP